MNHYALKNLKFFKFKLLLHGVFNIEICYTMMFLKKSQDFGPTSHLFLNSEKNSRPLFFICGEVALRSKFQ